ncbi:MAG: hypothetical protein LWY06_12205 [Firmicutes bacterium]|nr:hypothetical protein [Bacillota bacterium]
MKIVRFEYFTEETLFQNLRQMHLKGRPELTIYRDANISLKENADPSEINFAQYYVLEKDLNEISLTRKCLLEYGVDIFKLKGFVRVYFKDSETGELGVFDTLPPIVEISAADGGMPLLNDGMHRVYLAREAGSAINVVVVENADPAYPYYALPNHEGWNNLTRCTEVPDIKKNYRVKEYKTLFRDFNTSFINVTQQRTDKKPAALKVAGEKVAV